MMSTDIVIVGAGAAGIAAARWLESQGRRPLILEARDRVGGRAWTDTATFGFPVDMGCAWLHSADRNPWTALAREQGLEIVERPPVWQRRIGREEPTPEYHAAWLAAFERNERIVAAAAQQGRDVPVAELIPDDEFRTMFDAVMTWYVGTDSENISSVDFARYGDSETNWAVPSGLGSLVASGARSLDIRLATPVREIDYGGPRVRLHTDTGSVEAGAVIITASTALLADQAIRFVPDLPPETAEAFAGVPLGITNKVFLQLAPGTLPYDDTLHFIGTNNSTRTGSYATRPAGQDVMLAFYGGSFARELESHGELEAFAREELRGIFGAGFDSNIRRTLSTSWGLDPWARGSYSAALPGKAHLRERMSEPLQDRIFFAGEAGSLEHFGTIHGAWYSGVNAAKKALAAF